MSPSSILLTSHNLPLVSRSPHLSLPLLLPLNLPSTLKPLSLFLNIFLLSLLLNCPKLPPNTHRKAYSYSLLLSFSLVYIFSLNTSFLCPHTCSIHPLTTYFTLSTPSASSLLLHLISLSSPHHSVTADQVSQRRINIGLHVSWSPKVDFIGSFTPVLVLILRVQPLTY